MRVRGLGSFVQSDEQPDATLLDAETEGNRAKKGAKKAVLPEISRIKRVGWV